MAKSFQILLKRKSGGVEAWYGGLTWLNVEAIPFKGYTGTGDRNNDLAVIYVLPISQALLKADTLFTTGTSLIAAREPHPQDGQRIWGWGPNSFTQDQRLANQREAGRLVPILDSVRHNFTIRAADDRVRMCEGDSGGAATRDSMLDGVFSGADFAGLRCTSVDARQWWTRVDFRIGWLREQFFLLQHGRTSKPYQCAFIPGDIQNPKDWEHPLSFIDCNRK